MASTYPLEVVAAARWVKANPNVKDKALEDAMQKETWDASVKSLTAFPQVLAMMNEKLDMTQSLGDAFLAQQKEVLDAIQRLRGKAEQAGNLKTTKEQTVSTGEGKQSDRDQDRARPAGCRICAHRISRPSTGRGRIPRIRRIRTIRRVMCPVRRCFPSRLAWQSAMRCGGTATGAAAM
jgi:hypothetical protein